MSVDFDAFAGAVVLGLEDAHACLMVSRDGLALAAYPKWEEGRAFRMWSRIAALGEPERGFALVGDELWAFYRRDLYWVVAVAPATSRPGVILDHLERVANMAEHPWADENHLAARFDGPGATPAHEDHSDLDMLTKEFAGLIPDAEPQRMAQ